MIFSNVFSTQTKLASFKWKLVHIILDYFENEPLKRSFLRIWSKNIGWERKMFGDNFPAIPNLIELWLGVDGWLVDFRRADGSGKSKEVGRVASGVGEIERVDGRMLVVEGCPIDGWTIATLPPWNQVRGKFLLVKLRKFGAKHDILENCRNSSKKIFLKM